MCTLLVRIMFALMVAAAVPRAGGACANTAPYYDMSAYVEADVVLRAKVIGYRRDPKTSVAHFDLETVETLAGARIYLNPAKGAILKNVSWANSTFETPEIWKTKAIIVGVISSPDANGGIQLSLAQQLCNPNFILKDSEKNRKLLKSAFSMGKVAVLGRDLDDARDMENALRVMQVRLRILIASKAYREPQKMDQALRNMKAELEELSILSDRRPEPAAR